MLIYIYIYIIMDMEINMIGTLGLMNGSGEDNIQGWNLQIGRGVDCRNMKHYGVNIWDAFAYIT